jgi:serine/threonine protein kinase/formylglycine-generating enzyme required for sulfatase activity
MTEQSIFLAALDIPDPVKRAAYVASACAGNDALRTAVTALLAAHERPGPFLAEPAVAQLLPPESQDTRSLAPGAEPGSGATRTPETPGGEAGADVLAHLKPPTRAGALGRLAHYEIEEVLGSGGFGTVFRAFDERLHRVVAIKVLAPALAASGTARARFLREGRSAAAVRDLHVVSVHAVSSDDEPLPYLVMEFIGGQTLQQKLDRAGPLPVEAVLRIGTQIARGLAAAHATGLIHRDIKPANILLENGVERVKLTDFGLARTADDVSLSRNGVVAGTPLYMAPEQARGAAIDHRADLFSLGTVLYAMCTGRSPFHADSTLAVLKRVCEDAPPPVSAVNPAVPEWLGRIIAKLHSKDPAARFQTAAELADLLADCERQCQAHGGTLVDRSRIPGAPPAPPARWRSPWVSVWLVSVYLLGAVFFPEFRGGRRTPNSAPDPTFLTYFFIALGLTVVARVLLLAASDPGPRATRWRWRGYAGELVFVCALMVLGGYAWSQLPEHDPGGDDSTLAGPDSEGPERFASWRTDGGAPPWAVAPFSATRARAHQEAWAEYEGVPVEYENSVGMRFKLIPPGDFQMGSSTAEINWLKEKVPEYKTAPGWLAQSLRDEAPARSVSLGQPFYIGVHEVTVGQFRAFVRATGYRTDADQRPIGRGWSTVRKRWEPKAEYVWNNAELFGSESHPVVFVSRKDAGAFCAWLSRREGCRYTLPTEEQWEFACRAGTTTRWHFGDDPGLMKRYGWTGPEADGARQPVGGLTANPFGLHDMYGNVSEMAISARDQMVERGGDAGNSPYRARSAKREIQSGEWADPNSGRGFRVVIVTPPKK